MKNLKTLSLLVLLMAFCHQPLAQVSEWSEPVPFIVSTTDKTNAWLGKAGNYGPLLCWEEKVNDSSTAILYQRYLSNDPPVTLLSDPGVHYLHPQCLNLNYGSVDTTFLFFYERQENNETDIYYLKFTNEGNHSEPILLSASGTRNHELALCFEFGSNRLAWNSDGNIFASKSVIENGAIQFLEPVIVDTGNCAQPCLNMDLVLSWIKFDNNGDEVYFSHPVYPDLWAEPELLAQEDTIQKLMTSSTAMFSSVISWTFKENDLWYVANSNTWDTEIMDFTAETPFDFGVYTFDIITEQTDWWGEYYLTCVKNDGQNNEIFLYCEWSGFELEQLSYLGLESRNPKFYTGEENMQGWWTYIVWEAFADGNWQLYYSKAFFVWGSIDENQLSQDIQISPNPASDFIQIQNSKEINLSVQIFDISGKMIYNENHNAKAISIDLRKFLAGMYFIQFGNGNENFTQKVILK